MSVQQEAATLGQSFAAGAATAPQVQAQAQPQAAPRQDATFSWGSYSGMSGQPLAFSPASEQLTKLKDVLEKVFAGGSDRYKFRLIALDRENIIELTHSVLVVALTDKQNPKSPTAFQPIVLEGSSDPFPETYQNINGKNVPVNRLASDAVTSKLLGTVINELKAQLPGEDVLGTEPVVLQKDFNLNEDNKDGIHKFALEAVLACRDRLDSSKPGWADMNVALARKDSTLTARPAVLQNAPDQLDSLGLPVRGDLRLVLQAQQNGQTQGEGRISVVTELSAHMDLVWAPVNQVAQNPFIQQPMQMGYAAPSPKYQPRLTITSMRSPKLQTIGGQLLALSTVLALHERGLAMQAFRPRPLNKGEANLHDIGGIGVEAGLIGTDGQVIKQVIDTQATSFGDQGFYWLMGAAVRPDLQVTMMISEAGAGSWYNSAFLACAKKSEAAYKTIYDRANRLTNGIFQSKFAFGKPIAIADGRFHQGYFVDKSGEKRSLAHVDYLYVLNTLGVNDPTVIKDWSDSQAASAPLSEIERLAMRKRIIDHLFPSAVYTGYAQRVIISAEFLVALASSIAEAGLSMSTQSPFAVQSYERISAAYDQGTLLGVGQQTGLFSNGFSGQTNQAVQQQGYGMVGTRW